MDTHPTKHRNRECDVCSSHPFERNLYYEGKVMTACDFTAEQRYFEEKRRLLNRMLHGWGVVCGLGLEQAGEAIRIGKGLALDCCGREILVCRDEVRALEKPEDADSVEWIVCLEYDECEQDRVELPRCGCDERATWQYNRMREHYRLTLKRLEDFDDDHRRHRLCPLDDMRRASCAEVCAREGKHHDHWQEEPSDIDAYLRRELAAGCPSCRGECVVLGVVRVHYEDTCAPPRVEIDLSVRRVVYTAPVLGDLIDCFHGELPRVCKTNWQKHMGRRIHWHEFCDLAREGFEVWFSEPMDSRTLNRSTFLVSVSTVHAGTGTIHRGFIPGDVDLDECDRRAVFRPKSRWIRDEIENYSELRRGTEVEITLRGSLIRSAKGRALDGEPVAADGLPTGNGVEGGDFFSTFSVRRGHHENEEDREGYDQADE